MTLSFDQVKNLHYYVVGGQAFRGSLNSNDVERLTDADILLSQAKHLYLTVDSCGFVLHEIKEFLNTVDIELAARGSDICVPSHMVKNINGCVDAIMVVLSLISVPPVTNEDVKVTDGKKQLPKQLTFTDLREANYDVTNVALFDTKRAVVKHKSA